MQKKFLLFMILFSFPIFGGLRQEQKKKQYSPSTCQKCTFKNKQKQDVARLIRKVDELLKENPELLSSQESKERLLLELEPFKFSYLYRDSPELKNLISAIENDKLVSLAMNQEKNTEIESH